VSLADWIERRILPLRELTDHERRVRVMVWWTRLPRNELFLLNKLLTGEFRVGVSHTLVVRAVGEFAKLPTAAVEHRLMGNWQPSADAFSALVAPETAGDEPSRPYPFCLASPLDDPVDTLGARPEWLAEWKWDGIRAQLIHRRGEVFLWSRGEELITDRFPEIRDDAKRLADGTVLDGEVLAFADGVPRPFADLQRRIGRQVRVQEIALDVPVVFVAYDILEQHGADVRALPLRERRARLIGALEAIAQDRRIILSEELTAPTWDALALLRSQSRAHGVEGVMLKRWTSEYRPGRRRGDWWKWKIEPYTIDAVLIYAQPGSGRRASSSRTTPSACGTTVSSCRSRRHTQAWTTPRSTSWIAGFADIRPSDSGRSARSSRFMSSSSVSNASRHRRAPIGRGRPVSTHPPLASRQTGAEADTLDTLRHLVGRG
jgi:DNA ligase-1